MSQKYKALIFQIGTDGQRGETQHYVTEDRVTKEQIMSGDDDGVICLCFGLERAETIARLLNSYHDAGYQV